MAREARIMIGTGMQSVGKSYLTKKFKAQYALYHPTRPRFIIDPNDEDTWAEAKPLYWDIFEIQQYMEEKRKYPGRKLKMTKTQYNLQYRVLEGEWRISGKDKFGRKMDLRQMEITLTCMMEWTNSCLLITDDVNTFIDRFDREEVRVLFNNRRHRSQDQIFHIQSLKPIPPIWYTTGPTIRMQYDTFGVDKLKDRLDDHYDICKIANLCVKLMYEMHYDFAEKSPEWYKYRSFACYVDLANKKITGVPEVIAQKAMQLYIAHNNTEVRRIALEQAMQKKRLSVRFEDMEAAKHIYLSQTKKMYFPRG